MDDFLYNIRSNANNKRHDGNRKQYGGYNRNYDRQRKDNKSGYYNRNVHQEYLPLLKKAISDISDMYKRMAEAGERRAMAEERQARALEKLAAATLGEPYIPEEEPIKMSDKDVSDGSSAEDETSESQDADISADADHDTIMDVILDMRKEKVSYDKIAQFLADNGVPTPSGRGQWRGQIVSRLCRQ